MEQEEEINLKKEDHGQRVQGKIFNARVLVAFLGNYPQEGDRLELAAGWIMAEVRLYKVQRGNTMVRKPEKMGVPYPGRVSCCDVLCTYQLD